MIRTMRLENFKAFKDTGEIELKPITVLAGPNSGGKSTILQSLLLLKQTLDAPPEIDLSLDGNFLQFSKFSDLAFGKPSMTRSNIKFSFGVETVMGSKSAARYFSNLKSDNGSSTVTIHNQIELSFRYRKRGDTMAVVLDYFRVSPTLEGVDGPHFTGRLIKGKYRANLKGDGVTLPEHFKGRRIQNVIVRHFAPLYLSFEEDEEERGHGSILPLPIVFRIPLYGLLEALGDNLEYLGPLRERPRRAYLHSGNPLIEIGDSGQYAAQILWNERDKKVNFVPGLGKEPIEVTLMEAVNLAFGNLGISQPVDVQSQWSAIYQILFSINRQGTRKQVTIADVGFGMSQLLPILVLGLRSDESSLMLLEQPEIHLHPRLQANLADFLLTLSSQGKRIVVETHSDHFINRLRRRIAEDSTDKLSDEVNILFFHPPEDGNGASIEPLRVNRYGVIDNWPDDFLPEAANEAEAIFVAGLEKRRN